MSITDLTPAELTARVDVVRTSLQTAKDPTEKTTRLAAAHRSLELHDRGPGALLADRLGLSPTELNVLWLLGAIAVDAEVRRAVAELGVVPSPDPTLDVIRRLVYGVELSAHALRELGEGGLLRQLCLIERSDREGSHEHRATWAISSRMLAVLHGDNRVDSKLVEFANELIDALAVEDLVVAGTAATDIDHALRGKGNRVVVVFGMPGLGRRTTC